ncbi:hypothetical protein ALC62_03523, partial [Cyphomyrmex costatus]
GRKGRGAPLLADIYGLQQPLSGAAVRIGAGYRLARNTLPPSTLPRRGRLFNFFSQNRPLTLWPLSPPTPFSFAFIQTSSSGTAAKGLKFITASVLIPRSKRTHEEDERRIAGIAARRTGVADTSSDRIESSSSAIDRFSFRSGVPVNELGGGMGHGDGEERGEANPRGSTRRGREEDEGEEHRRWLSETPRPHDQCHDAFIVLQQKGAHQSTGISSRLISRSHPLVLTRFAALFPSRNRNPYGGPSFTPLPRLFLSHSGLRGSASSAFLLPTFHPSSARPSPPFFVRSVGKGVRAVDRGWAADSGTT